VPFRAAAFLWTGVSALHRRVFPRGVELVEIASPDASAVTTPWIVGSSVSVEKP
jgi:hypothetical protein